MGNDADCYRRYLDGDDNGIIEIIDIYHEGLTLYLNSIVDNMVRAEYDKLTTEQQHILGCYLGIFGYDKMPVSDIADMLMVTRNAVDKKINKALEKLYEHV